MEGFTLADLGKCPVGSRICISDHRSNRETHDDTQSGQTPGAQG